MATKANTRAVLWAVAWGVASMPLGCAAPTKGDQPQPQPSARPSPPPTATTAAADRPPPQQQSGPGAANAVIEGAWSATERGVRARLLVRPGETTNDTRMLQVDLELENVSDVGNPLELFWDVDAAVVSRLVDETGADIPPPALPTSIKRPPPFWLVLPYQSALRMSITTYGYGVRPGLELFIGLPASKAWAIAPGETRQLFLSATLSIPEPSDRSRRAWHGTLELPKVKIR